MQSRNQTIEYFTIEYGFDADVVIHDFFASTAEEIENPEMYALTWKQVQITLHKYYNDISKSYADIAGDWSDKSCEEYYNPPKTNAMQADMWNTEW
jgi:hypothetical protein